MSNTAVRQKPRSDQWGSEFEVAHIGESEGERGRGNGTWSGVNLDPSR